MKKLSITFLNINLRISKHYEGFTLAEVLITLGIIGIVAAMTIPTLMQNMQDQQFKTAFRKASSVLSQAYSQAVQENGNGFGAYSCDSSTTTAKFSAIKAKIKVVQDCKAGNIQGQCWSNIPVTPTMTSDCSKWVDAVQYNNDAFVTADGMSWLIYGTVADGGCSLMAVDVNGIKEPNKWGRDVWTFRINDSSIDYGLCMNTITINGVNGRTYVQGVISGKY